MSILKHISPGVVMKQSQSFRIKTCHLYLVKSEFVYSSYIMILDIKKTLSFVLYYEKNIFLQHSRLVNCRNPQIIHFFPRAVIENVTHVVVLSYLNNESQYTVFLNIIMKDFFGFYTPMDHFSRLHVYILTKIRCCFFLSSYPLSRFYKKERKHLAKQNVNRFLSSPTKKR